MRITKGDVPPLGEWLPGQRVLNFTDPQKKVEWIPVAKVIEFPAEGGNVTAQYRQLTKDNQALQSDVNELKRQRNSYLDRVLRVESAITELEIENKRTRDTLAMVENTNKRIREEMDEVKKELDETRKKCKRTEELNEQFTTICAQLFKDTDFDVVETLDNKYPEACSRALGKMLEGVPRLVLDEEPEMQMHEMADPPCEEVVMEKPKYLLLDVEARDQWFEYLRLDRYYSDKELRRPILQYLKLDVVASMEEIKSEVERRIKKKFLHLVEDLEKELASLVEQRFVKCLVSTTDQGFYFKGVPQ
jgi:hypothetical protein